MVALYHLGRSKGNLQRDYRRAESLARRLRVSTGATWLNEPRQAVRLFYPRLLDGDDHEHHFQLAGAARHNSAIIDGWSGGQLEALVGGLHDLAHRARGDRAALLDERPRAQGYWAHSLGNSRRREGTVG